MIPRHAYLAELELGDELGVGGVEQLGEGDLAAEEGAEVAGRLPGFRVLDAAAAEERDE